MAERPSRDDQKLLRVAQAVVDLLQPAVRGMDVKVQKPRPPWKTASDGWMTIIGDLGKGKPSIEIWLDGFSRHKSRRFYAGFHSSQETLIEWLAYASKSAVPRRRLADAELVDSEVWKLKNRLTEVDLDVPLLETYRDQHEYFFGLYDSQSSEDEQKFANRATTFFLDVLRAVSTQKQDDDADVYTRHENRKQVKSHLQHERSQFLARRCKERDKFVCQVCGFKFVDLYGALGEGFAEAHHIVALASLPDEVKTALEDLITVCSNCHRMLHRMDGKATDVADLKAVVLASTNQMKESLPNQVIGRQF